MRKPFKSQNDGIGLSEGPLTVTRDRYGDALRVSVPAADGKAGRFATSVFGGKISTMLFHDKSRSEVTDPQILADQKALFLAAFGGATMARLCDALDRLQPAKSEENVTTEGHAESEVSKNAAPPKVKR